MVNWSWWIASLLTFSRNYTILILIVVLSTLIIIYLFSGKANLTYKNKQHDY